MYALAYVFVCVYVCAYVYIYWHQPWTSSVPLTRASLSLTELSLTELKPETQRSIDFAAVDKDANGVLDTDELVATLTHDLPHSLMHDHAGELLELVDNNGDERASHEEILLNHRDFVDGLLTGSHGEL